MQVILYKTLRYWILLQMDGECLLFNKRRDLLDRETVTKETIIRYAWKLYGYCQIGLAYRVRNEYTLQTTRTYTLSSMVPSYNLDSTYEGSVWYQSNGDYWVRPSFAKLLLLPMEEVTMKWMKVMGVWSSNGLHTIQSTNPTNVPWNEYYRSLWSCTLLLNQ